MRAPSRSLRHCFLSRGRRCGSSSPAPSPTCLATSSGCRRWQTSSGTPWPGRCSPGSRDSLATSEAWSSASGAWSPRSSSRCSCPSPRSIVSPRSSSPPACPRRLSGLMVGRLPRGFAARVRRATCSRRASWPRTSSWRAVRRWRVRALRAWCPARPVARLTSFSSSSTRCAVTPCDRPGINGASCRSWIHWRPVVPTSPGRSPRHRGAFHPTERSLPVSTRAG